MKEKVQYCFVSENKNACQEGEAWGIIYIIKPNLSQLTCYPEFHDLDSIRWSVIGIGSNYVALTRDTDLALHTRDGRIRGVVANRDTDPQ